MRIQEHYLQEKKKLHRPAFSKRANLRTVPHPEMKIVSPASPTAVTSKYVYVYSNLCIGINLKSNRSASYVKSF